MPELELPDDIDAIARALPVVPHGLDELRWLLASLPPLSPNSLPGTMPAELPPSDGTAASSGSGATGPAAGTLTAPFADNTGTSLLPGSLPLTPFASNIRPVVLVTTLPTLPSSKYLEGTFVYKTSDVPPRLYKNVADAWVAGIGPSDIEANSITAGQIAAGAINTDELAANAVTTAKLATGQITLYDSTGAVALSPAGFGGVWQRFLATGFFNGDFYAPPPTLSTQLNDSTNPLPWWAYTRVSGTACTATVVSDSSGASGYALRLALASGAAGDECYVQQIIPVSGSRGQSFAYHLAATFNRVAYTANNAQIYISVQHLKKDGVTTTGSLITWSTTLGNGPAGTLDDLTSYGATLAPPPADAYWARVRFGLKRNTAATTETGTVDVYEVRVQRGPQILVVGDDDGSTSPATIEAVNSVILIKPEGKNTGRIQISPTLFAVETRFQIDPATGEITTYSNNDFDSYTPANTGWGGATFTTMTGRYIQLGKLVWVSIDCVVNGAGSGASSIGIGLPVAADTTMIQTLSGYSNVTASGTIVGAIGAGGSYSYMDRIYKGGSTAALTGADATAGRVFRFTGWYRAA